VRPRPLVSASIATDHHRAIIPAGTRLPGLRTSTALLCRAGRERPPLVRGAALTSLLLLALTAALMLGPGRLGVLDVVGEVLLPGLAVLRGPLLLDIRADLPHELERVHVGVGVDHLLIVVREPVHRHGRAHGAGD